jgi:hypothetical protein
LPAEEGSGQDVREQRYAEETVTGVVDKSNSATDTNW